MDENDNQERYFNHLKDNVERLLLEMSVPKRNVKSSFDNFTKGDKLVSELKNTIITLEDNNLLLYGPTGSGKTHLSISLLREMILTNNSLVIKKETNFVTTRGKFITAPELFLSIREIYRGKVDKSETSLISEYTNIPLLIIDDMGSEKASEWTISTLYLIINSRLNNMNPTIITTNYDLNTVNKILGERITSRLSSYKNIKISLPDYRRKR